ncbi:hypothetical protein [Oryzifoliimicrobium ureilyticus]|uniref:hypothetical protein n=1 Tax=Oryzifoliimicrobium ureilyticus TaxID=3113724 RepID=UPI0030765FA3
MLPNDPEKLRDCLLRWTGGNAPAAAFLAEIAEIARLADDIVDEDEHRQRNVCWLLSRVLTVLPLNPFYLAHGRDLAPLLNTLIVDWQLSDAYRLSGDPLKQTHGFVRREGIANLVTAVAGILGGYEHARAVAADVFETCLAGSKEMVEDWVAEH